jgi:hypothetical protein
MKKTGINFFTTKGRWQEGFLRKSQEMSGQAQKNLPKRRFLDSGRRKKKVHFSMGLN